MRRFDKPIPFGWYALEYSAALAPGEVKTFFYFGREVVLYRTASGQARVVDAFCPHLGAHLGHGGRVVGEHIKCPFHGWEFDGEGACAAISYAKRIPPKASGANALPSYPVRECNQMVWAWYHPRGAAPTYELERIEELHSPDWSEVETFEWTVDTIIQEAGENGADPAHFLEVHRNQTMPEGEVFIEGVRRRTLFKNRIAAISVDGERDRSGTKFEDLHTESVSIGPGQAYQRFSRLFDIVMMAAVTPIDDQRIHFRALFTMPKKQGETHKLFAEASRDEIVRQIGQDVPIWNNKRYLDTPMLCDGDGPIAKYRTWFNQFYPD